MAKKSLQTAFEAAWNPKHEPIPFRNPWGMKGAYTTTLIEINQIMPLFYEKHIIRLNESLEYLGLDNPFAESFIGERIQILMGKLKKPCLLRIAVATEGLFISSHLQTGKGADLAGRICKIKRHKPKAKSLMDIMLYNKLNQIDRNAEELLLINQDGYTLEGATTNLLSVSGKTIMAPTQESLHGITRQIIQENLPDHWRWESVDIKLADLNSMDEILLCGSGKEVARLVDLQGSKWRPSSNLAFKEIKDIYESAKKEWYQATIGRT